MDFNYLINNMEHIQYDEAGALFLGFTLMILTIIYLPFYLYQGYVFFKIGKDNGIRHPGLSFVPGGQFYIKLMLSGISIKWLFALILLYLPVIILTSNNIELMLSSYFVFLIIIMGLMRVIAVVMDWKVFERFGKPGWLSLLVFIPVPLAILVVYSFIAFEKRQ